MSMLLSLHLSHCYSCIQAPEILKLCPLHLSPWNFDFHSSMMNLNLDQLGLLLEETSVSVLVYILRLGRNGKRIGKNSRGVSDSSQEAPLSPLVGWEPQDERMKLEFAQWPWNFKGNPLSPIPRAQQSPLQRIAKKIKSVHHLYSTFKQEEKESSLEE